MANVAAWSITFAWSAKANVATRSIAIAWAAARITIAFDASCYTLGNTDAIIAMTN